MAQDSPLGQPITGFRGVDAPLNLLGMLTAIKSGNLGSQLANFQYNQQRAQLAPALLQQQQLENAKNQTELSQAPEAREMLRLQGPNSPIAKLLGLQGPAVPSAAAMLTGGNIGPEALAQLQSVKDRGLAAGMPTDTPSVVTTDKSSERDLRGAQTKVLEASLAGMSGSGRPAGIPADWVPLTLSDTPGKPSRVTWGPPPSVNYPMGTINPATGKPYNPGEKDPSGRTPNLTPSGSGGTAAQNVRGQIARIDALNAQIASTYTDGKGKIAEPLRKLAEQTMIPGADQGGLQGTGVALLGHVPGVSTVQMSRVESISRDKNQPKEIRDAATRLLGRQAFAANMTKAFGDAGNIAEGEQEKMEKLLPNENDSPDQMQQKIDYLNAMTSQLKEALQGQSMTKGQFRAVLSQLTGAELKARDTASDADPAVLPDTPSAGGAAPTGNTSYNPAHVGAAMSVIKNWAASQ